MNKNRIKDDELENVNGGTHRELSELFHTLKIPVGDIGKLRHFLEQHDIKAVLYDDQITTNVYINMKTNEDITHEDDTYHTDCSDDQQRIFHGTVSQVQ